MISKTLGTLLSKMERWQMKERRQLVAIEGARIAAKGLARYHACYRCELARFGMTWPDKKDKATEEWGLILLACAGGITLPLRAAGSAAGHEMPASPFFCSQESREPAPGGLGGGTGLRSAPITVDGGNWEAWEQRAHAGEKS